MFTKFERAEISMHRIESGDASVILLWYRYSISLCGGTISFQLFVVLWLIQFSVVNSIFSDRND